MAKLTEEQMAECNRANAAARKVLKEGEQQTEPDLIEQTAQDITKRQRKGD